MSELEGRIVAISIGDAPDRARLGFPQREVDRALLSTCTALVRAGAEIAYAGHLKPEGYTFKIFRHLAGAYAGSRETPFRHFVPEPVARGTRYADLLAVLNEGRGVVTTEIARGEAFVPVRPGGGGIRLGDEVVSNDMQLSKWFAAVAPRNAAEGYRTTRRMMSSRVDARVVMGGKMGVLSDPGDTYQGAMPGIVEEAIVTLELGKPLVVLGAFGGAARDVAIALKLLDADHAVPRGEQNATYRPSIDRVAALSDRIPGALRDVLAHLADDDRAEQNAFRTASAIAEWLTTPR
ncbi:hypothetical protein B7H23_03260 [Notoacmeibacter marinus]|uniref:Uncharacterized protein n=1 Tax=Notoacmeibacter marinus TaxID=1876515 RepID=A0A231V188_9HYPH|nr:hypothetical protein [Notoacmeibacter marinus]OXT01969.1 hypothetical protein B7H23_03260 [Notoacmeibacter marinus]